MAPSLHVRSTGRVRHLRRVAIVALAALALVVGACTQDAEAPTKEAATRVRLVTHDSFAVSDAVLEAFEADSGIDVQIVPLGDAGAALNQAVLNKRNPIGDVFFGIDNAFLSRALDEDLFVPYEATGLDRIPARFRLDPRHRATPVDHGEVCVNYDQAFFTEGMKLPETFDDLLRPELRDQLVVQNPATSSPGLAFLLATVAKYGEDGYRDYWKRLRANGVAVVNGWEEAYNQSFSGGAGTGDRALVVSYASSPPAEVVYSDPPRTTATTGVATGTCFEQVEMAGILRGTKHLPEARRLVDFLISKKFQEDMPLRMFVFPVLAGARLPKVFEENTSPVTAPFRMAPEEIGNHRDRWIREWTAVVLG